MDTIKLASVFVPELASLGPQIAAGSALAKKLRATLAPALARVEIGEPALLEEAEAAAALNDMLPDLVKALKTCDALEALYQKYAAKLAEAAK